ncbi:MAG: 3,4-dihydroxy-2-butanone-4-phosphate synthase [Mycobacterium sp.]
MTAEIAQALTALREGSPILVVDDADRENEGDVVMAAATTTPEWVAWTIRNSSGLLCAPVTAAHTQRFALPQMVAANQDSRRTAYTVSVDATDGVTTGISARDRSTTLRTLADPGATAQDLIRPGHVFPLLARPGGVLERPGHTEAAVDLCRLAGVEPVAAIAELVTDSGSMMRSPEIVTLGQRMQLPVLRIDHLIGYRRTHPHLLPDTPSARVRRSGESTIITAAGSFHVIAYLDLNTGAEHLALVRNPGGSRSTESPLVRVHSECLTGESFRSYRCECGPQLDAALAKVAAHGGVVVYLRGHEGRGIGLQKKIAAYHLQDRGLDTVEANVRLGEPVDAREYGAAAAILVDLEIDSVQLMTNNPDKVAGLETGGVKVARRLPLVVGARPENLEYLAVKRERLGHLLPRCSIS